MSANLMSKLCQTLIEVVADLSFICLLELPGEEPPPNTGQQLQAMIPVHQPYEEKFFLTVEAPLMQEITCNIYGLEAAQLTEEDQIDTLNELLNNIAGKFMQILTPSSIQFELGLPVPHIERTTLSEPVLNLVFHSDESYLVFSLIGTNLISEVRK